MSYGWSICQRDGGGPYAIGESEWEFNSPEAAIEDARSSWDDYIDPEFIQVHRRHGDQYELVAGWSPAGGTEIWMHMDSAGRRG